MDVEQDEDAADAFVLQEVVAEAERQGVGESGNVSELLEDLDGEVEPMMGTRATQRTQATLVEFSESEPEERPRAQLSIPGLRATPTKKKTRDKSSKSFKSSASVAEVGRKKQNASNK